MAKASVTGTIAVVSNGTTLNAIIQCQLGDLYQTYLGDPSAPTNIYPDFEASGATKPILVFLLYSAEKGSGNGLEGVSNSNMHWFIGSEEIIFDSQGLSTNNWNGKTGHFTKTTQKIYNDDGATYTTVPALQVNKNLVQVNNCISFLIRGEADISLVNSAAHITAQYQVSISYGTENTKKVTIIAADTKYFTISDKGGHCQLKAWVDNKDATNLGYTFKWYISEGGEWKLLSETSDVLTVEESQVNTSALIKLEVYKDDNLYGMDVQTVNDVSDPYHISPNPLNASGDPTIEQFTKGSGESIKYKPVLWYNTNGNVTKVKGQNFIMNFFDFAGIAIDGLQFTTAAQEFVVAEAKVSAHGGALYIIQTSD